MKLEYRFRTIKNISDRRIMYIDEIDFTKKYKGLRRICPKTFKYLCFDFFKNDLFKKENGHYVDDLPTTEAFKKIYGQIQIIYTIQNNCIVIEDLKPHEILIANYMSEMKIYKGVPYNTERDKFKIEIVERMKGR